MQAATTKLILNNMKLQLSTFLLFMYIRYHKAFSHIYAIFKLIQTLLLLLSLLG